MPNTPRTTPTNSSGSEPNATAPDGRGDQQTRLAALAHELRAPLASILLYAQLLREGNTVEMRDLKRIGDALERAVKQQTQLINQLLEDVEVTAEQPSPEDVPVTAKLATSSDQTTPIPRRSLDRPGKIKPYTELKDVRILYIDDDFSTREAVFEVLELTGAQVALAASTSDGMMALQTFKPHVIVCDIAMPGEDGYAFLRKLRASDVGRTIPVLALTGLASPEGKLDALAAGFQLYLAKPVDIDRLRDSVAQLVDLIES